MTNSNNKTLSVLLVVLMLGAIAPITATFNNSGQDSKVNDFVPSDLAANQIPLSRVAFVAPDPTSYVDEFAYMAAVPTSIFHVLLRRLN